MTGPARRSPVRLGRPYSPIPVAVLILLIWWVVAHNSGSGWVQLLGDAVFGMLLIGLFLPAALLSRIDIQLLHAPPDGGVGKPSLLTLTASGRARITPLEPPGPSSFVGPTAAGTDHVVSLLPLRRGTHDSVLLELATAAPFGLQWWTRRITLDLAVPLHVAPKLGQPFQLPGALDDRRGALGDPQPAETGDARGIRGYRPGDRRSRVHYRASAHAGRLMVREMEEPAAQPVTLRLQLPVDSEAAELMAERAFGTIVNLLDRGVPVVLATDEVDRKVVAPVSSHREAGRRLARATASQAKPGVEFMP